MQSTLAAFDHQADVVIVGGSFAGWSAALQLGRARRTTLVVDSGKPRNRFAAASHGLFGHDGKAPFELLKEARQQALRYPTVLHWEAEVTSSRKAGDGLFEVGLASQRNVSARRIILATGVRDVLPGIPGIQERWGVSALHCPYCHGYEFAGGALGVLAGSPHSVHQALLVSEWGPVVLFTQGVLEPTEDELAQLSGRGVAVERTAVTELAGPAPALEAVRLADARVVPLRAIYLAPRTEFASDIAAELGCETLTGPTGPLLRVDEWRQTSVPNVFAAGDNSNPLTTASAAIAAGALAGVAAHRSLWAEGLGSLSWPGSKRSGDS